MNAEPSRSGGPRCHLRGARSLCCATSCASVCSTGAGQQRQARSLRPLFQEAKLLAVLDDAAAGIVTTRSADGLQPFTDSTMEATPMGEESENRLPQFATTGEPSGRRCTRDSGTPAGSCGGTGGVESATHAQHMPADLAARGASAARQTSGMRGCRGMPPGELARAHGHSPDAWIMFRVGTARSRRVLPGPLQPAPLGGAMRRPAGCFSPHKRQGTPHS